MCRTVRGGGRLCDANFGANYSERAISAARELLRETGHADERGPWVPIGAAVHSGTAWFGAIGREGHTELAFVGDAVNTTARLAASTDAGEILVSSTAAAHAGLNNAGHRSLELKGKAEHVAVISLWVRPS